MKQESPFISNNSRHDSTFVAIKKDKLDLIVLRYMARRLHLILHQLDTPIPTISDQPFIYHLPERYGRMHRIAIYKYQELLFRSNFTFVGFISHKQKNLQPHIIAEIEATDRKLVNELVGNPGILSYSSLELRNGDWCNLVVMNNANAKTHLKNTKTHTYAAHQLAGHYYEWIRLHNGIMSEGLDHTEMHLQKTRHYSFTVAQQRPAMREENYGNYAC
jgi:hypothetical protein